MVARSSTLTAAALLAASPLLAIGHTRADEPRRVELTWSADPSCPSGGAVVAEVERLVRGAPPKDVVVARAKVEHDGTWRVRLETKSGDRVGIREVEAETCAQLGDATALILALMIDPTAAMREMPEPPGPRAPPFAAREQAPARTLPPPAPVVSAPHRPPPHGVSIRGVAALSAVGDVGNLPAAAIGVGGSAGLGIDAYRVTLDLSAFPTRTGHAAQRPAAGGDFTLVAGALVACRTLLALDRFRGGVCLGAELDTVLAKGFGVSSPQSGSTRWGALAAGALVEARIVHPLSTELRVGGAVPFSRPPFYFDDIGTVYRPSVVGFRVAIGLVAHF
jgi:hypothetical protein